MPVKRYNKKRDCRFDDWRRNNMPKGGIKMNLPLYSSDLDSVEFIYEGDDVKPVALIEKKSDKSNWREGEMPGPIKATFKLSQLAGIPYYVAVHNEDRSEWKVYHSDAIEDLPNNCILDGILFDYVVFLCEMHKYSLPDVFVKALRKVKGIDQDGNSIEF